MFVDFARNELLEASTAGSLGATPWANVSTPIRWAGRSVVATRLTHAAGGSESGCRGRRCRGTASGRLWTLNKPRLPTGRAPNLYVVDLPGMCSEVAPWTRAR